MADTCSSCRTDPARPAPDSCRDIAHRSTDTTLGVREADCGCCTVVDSVALALLRQLATRTAPPVPLSEAWSLYESAGRPPVCPRCGGWDGPTLPDCTATGWSHAETCARTRYADDLCAPCEAVLHTEIAEPLLVGPKGTL